MGLYGSRERADRQARYTAHEKAAKITLRLFEGAELSTSKIASEIGTTYHGARYMMEAMSRVVPIYEMDGKWKMVEDR